MLPFYPEPDEALFGFIVRCARCLGQSLSEFRNMLGAKHQLRECCSDGWGGGIAAHCGLDPKMLLEQHTAFKVQLFFCAEAERQLFYQESFLRPTVPYRYTPFSCKENLTRYHIRFCRKCAAEDMRTVGIPIIRNSWQLPFIDHCSKHKTGLSWLDVKALETFMRNGRCPAFETNYQYVRCPQEEVLQRWIQQIMAAEQLPDIRFHKIYKYLISHCTVGTKIFLPYVYYYYVRQDYAEKSFYKSSALQFIPSKQSWQLLYVLSQIFPERNIIDLMQSIRNDSFLSD